VSLSLLLLIVRGLPRTKMRRYGSSPSPCSFAQATRTAPIVDCNRHGIPFFLILSREDKPSKRPLPIFWRLDVSVVVVPLRARAHKKGAVPLVHRQPFFCPLGWRFFSHRCRRCQGGDPVRRRAILPCHTFPFSRSRPARTAEAPPTGRHRDIGQIKKKEKLSRVWSLWGATPMAAERARDRQEKEVEGGATCGGARERP
jgi:hypothetical protein